MSQPSFRERDRLSLCMIVRDEEQKLARCLASAAPWAGELVVVDTGSTDGTVAIAESFGARVVFFPWCDDFAAARNAALEAATREWALVLDADEELVVDDPITFSAALRQKELAGFSLPCHNQTDDGGISIGNLFRLFRRTLPGMRYRGQIHEQVIAVAEGQVATAVLSGTYLRHDGYTRQAMQEKRKVERNLSLSKALVDSRPEDPFAWYCLGLSLAEVNVAEMVSAFERALSLLEASGHDGAGEAYVLSMIVTLLQVQGAERAEVLCDRGLRLFPGAPDLLYRRGLSRLAAGDAAAAARDLETCLRPEASRFFLVADPACVAYGAQAHLGLAYLQLGRNQEGEALLRASLLAAPSGFAPACRALGEIAMQRGLWDEALPLLEATLASRPEEDAVRRNLGWCLFKLERYEEAERCLRPLGDRPDVQQLRGQIALDAGHGQQALALLAECPLPSAGLALGWAHYVLGQAGAAAEAWNRWLRAGAADWGTKDTLAMFLFLLEGGRPPSGEPERPAEPLRDMTLWFRLLLRYERFEAVEQVVTRAPQLSERLWWPLRKQWAITLVKEGFDQLGLHLLLEARADAPEDAELYYWLGVCAERQHQPEEAVALWNACLAITPGHGPARQALSQRQKERSS